MNDNNLREKRIDGSEVFSGKLLHVFHDRVILPNGHEAGRDLIRHVGAVCVVPITDDGNVRRQRELHNVRELLFFAMGKGIEIDICKDDVNDLFPEHVPDSGADFDQ